MLSFKTLLILRPTKLTSYEVCIQGSHRGMECLGCESNHSTPSGTKRMHKTIHPLPHTLSWPGASISEYINNLTFLKSNCCNPWYLTYIFHVYMDTLTSLDAGFRNLPHTFLPGCQNYPTSEVKWSSDSFEGVVQEVK